jgi:hypothetical protein
LPAGAQLDPALGRDACPWLDDYVAFSRHWSPRAFDGFHEAAGLWLLSTVAARRIKLELGGPRYTPLFILLAARTSLFAKTTTVKIAMDILKVAGLSWLLAADTATPAKFISDLTVRLPGNYDDLDWETRATIKNRLALAGQRGWFYEEFGQHLYAMNRRDGPMADFKGIVRRFDDCYDRYETGTIGRGSDVVHRPYLALLGCLTPADLQPFTKKRGSMWNDGFWARFAFVTPPAGVPRKKDRFPPGERVIPPRLTAPIVQWHDRLGLPAVTLTDRTDDEGKPTGAKTVTIGSYKPIHYELGPGVFDAYYAYGDALGDVLEENSLETTDFDGNYVRFPAKALRVALLLASMEGKGDVVEMRHWARGQEIAERWRVYLHEVYSQVNYVPSESEQLEEKILALVASKGEMTARDMARHIRGKSATDLAPAIKHRVRFGELAERCTKRTSYFYLPEKE